MKLAFHVEALDELMSAAEYYESREPGLGTRFLDMLDEALDRIGREPIAWSCIDEDVRRCLLRVLPFGILYTV